MKVVAYVLMVLMTVAGLGFGFNYATEPAEEESEESDRFEYLSRIDSAEVEIVHKFENISGSSVGFQILPEDATHLRITFALLSEDSYVNISGFNYTGYNKTHWIPIDEPIIIEARGGDIFPDDDRCDYLVVHILPHPPEEQME